MLTNLRNFCFQIASLDDMFEWLVPATFNYLQNGRDMKLSITFSEPHLFTSMLRILRAVLGIDETIAKEQQQHSGVGDKGGAGEKAGAGATATTAGAGDAAGTAQQADTVQTQVDKITYHIIVICLRNTIL